ncbi:MAG TPA: peptidylprolyl isomerase [Bryobacteraceae bacterium]|nr:peptidylprolyl isomerase [Bryobacteraceae bacterium]
MAPKKTNAQKARERREEAAKTQASQPQTTKSQATSQPLESTTENSRKKWTVIGLIGIALLFAVAFFAAERLLGDDDADDSTTPTIEAAAGGAQDLELSSRCWPTGGPVPGNATDAASPPTPALNATLNYTAVLETNYGSFTVEFYPDDAPNTVNNFVCLANEGYYDGTLFHRVMAGFMFQGGDPLGTGSGGPGYRFADEPIVRDYVTGTVAMANAGPDTNGSQFFVVLDNLTELGRLPKNYTIFGQVIEGMDVVAAIGAIEVGPSATGEMSVPVEPVQLISVSIVTTPKT